MQKQGKGKSQLGLLAENQKKQKKNELLMKKKRKSKSGSNMHLVKRQKLIISPEVNGNYDENDSVKKGKKSFEWMLQSYDLKAFFSDYWEKKALLIKGKNPTNYTELLSTNVIDNILKNQNVMFTKNLDITSYNNGTRSTHNPEGRAMAPVVWNFYGDGCSIRLLNPQTFHQPIWELLESLQEYFGSFCGANVYLTPPGTQGFAPHYDDIEAFILQLEGKKRWRVYRPKFKLPRTSSGNFGPDDDLGELVIDQVVEAGDFLYFPRGFIHQGNALDDEHSLHITISTYQRTAWADFLEKFLPEALTVASAKCATLREGLPIGYSRHLGVANTEEQSSFKTKFKEQLKYCMEKLMEFASIDDAADELAKNFIEDALPPKLTKEEELVSVHGDGEKWCDVTKKIINKVEITSETCIRLIRKGCVRLVMEDDEINLYSTVQNSREYHELDPLCISIEDNAVPAIESLIKKYPEYIPVGELLEEEDSDDKIELATALWEKGIVITKKPLFSEK